MINYLTKPAQPAARRVLAELRDAEDREHAETAIGDCEALFGAKCPKAVAKITDDRETLPAFYDFPVEHWVHLKTTNPIESLAITVGQQRNDEHVGCPATGGPQSDGGGQAASACNCTPERTLSKFSGRRS